VSGDVLRRETGDEDNFLQCGEFFRSALDADARERLTDNIVAGQIACAQEFIRERAIANFTCADVDYERMIRDKVKDITAGRKKSCQRILAAPLSPPRIVPAHVLALTDSCRSFKSIG
jgi:catalase